MRRIALGVLLVVLPVVLAGVGAAKVHLRRASEFYKAGKLKEAVDEYAKVIEADPENVAACLGIAAAYRDLGQTARAIEYLRKAASLDPQNWMPYFSQAMIYVGRRDFKAADRMFDEARRRAPDNKKVIVTQALARMQSGDPAGALQILERARKLYPDDPYVVADTGLAMVRAGKEKEGLQLLAGAAEKWPDNRWVAKTRRRAVYEREEKIWRALPDGAAELRKVLAGGDELRAALAKIKLGTLELKEGKGAEALRLLEEVIAEKGLLSRGRRGEAMTVAGKAGLKLGRYADALERFAAAAALCPEDPFIRYEFAACLAVSDKSKALENLQKAVRLATSPDQRRAIRRRAMSEKAFEKLKRDKVFEKIMAEASAPEK